MKCLIVDDNDDLRELLETILESAGYTVDVAINGKEAMRMAVHFPPDIVISDILMPEMDGFTLCRTIKEDATLHNIPFIFYTGVYLNPEHEKLAQALGASAYLRRPVEPDQLLQEIERVTSRYQGHKLSVPVVSIKNADELTQMHEDALVQQLAKQVEMLEGEIRDRKQAEERVEGLNKILEESLNEIYIFDAETMAFIQVNRGARMNLGYTLDELRNLTPLDLKPEFTKTSFEKLLKPLMTGEKEKLQITAVHRRKDRSFYPVEIHLQLSTLESRKVFVAIIFDITERKTAEQSLKASLIGTIVAVSKAVEARDPYTGSHQQQVAQLALRIAQKMELDADWVDGLRMAATIHDIGKIHLPAEILSKPSKLSEIEF